MIVGNIPKIKKLISCRKILLITFLLCGCNSLTIHLPVARFESPEAAGETWKKHLSVGGAGTHDVTVVQDASTRPPTIGTPSISQGGNAPLRFSLGFWERFELGLHYGITNAPFMVSGKFQILGDPIVKAKGGNFSIAVTAAAGVESSTNNGTQLGTFGPGGYPWNATANTQVQDYALIAGIRLTDNLLLYGGPFISKYNMTGNVHDNQSDNGTSPAADYSINGSGQNTGGNLAIQLDTSNTFSLTLEAVASNFQWSNISGSNDIQTGLLLDWFW